MSLTLKFLSAALIIFLLYLFSKLRNKISLPKSAGQNAKEKTSKIIKKISNFIQKNRGINVKILARKLNVEETELLSAFREAEKEKKLTGVVDKSGYYFWLNDEDIGLMHDLCDNNDKYCRMKEREVEERLDEKLKKY